MKQLYRHTWETITGHRLTTPQNTRPRSLQPITAPNSPGTVRAGIGTAAPRTAEILPLLPLLRCERYSPADATKAPPRCCICCPRSVARRPYQPPPVPRFIALHRVYTPAPGACIGYSVNRRRPCFRVSVAGACCGDLNVNGARIPRWGICEPCKGGG